MEILEQISTLYCRINNIYLELYLLELYGKRDNVFYLELIWLLRGMLEEEKVLFEILYEDYNDIYNYIWNSKQDGVSLEARLSDYLRDEHYFDVDSKGDEFLLDDINVTKLYGICFKNIVLLYLSFLQEIINSRAFEKFRSKLLNIKYNNAFISHDIEEILVDFNFDVLRVNYVNLDVFLKTLKLDGNIGNDIISKCFMTIINGCIRQLLDISDMDYNDTNKICLSLNNQCLLRAVLSLMTEKKYYNVESLIYDEINRGRKNDNNISFDIINSIINIRKKDKERVRKISVTPVTDC